MARTSVTVAVVAVLTVGVSQASFAQGADSSGAKSPPPNSAVAPDNKSENMPKTNLKETVIHKSGVTEKPMDQAPKGETK